MVSTSSQARPRSWTATQAIALLVGVVLTLGGIAGLIVTGFSDFTTPKTGDTLLGLEINPMQNVIHLALGIVGLAMWQTYQMARTYSAVLFLAFGVAFVYGLFTVNSYSDSNFMSLNGPSNTFHLIVALVGLVAMMLPATTKSGMTKHRPSAI